MRIKFIYFILILLLAGSFVTGYAQNAGKFDPLKDDIANKLPPLSVLLDSATSHNHYVQFRNLQVIVNKCKLKTSQEEWMRNLGFQANVGYGNLYNYSVNNSGDVASSTIATSRSETKYNGAIYFNMPLFTITGRKNQINLAKTEVEQAQAMAGEQSDETRQLVIRQYNDLILKQRLLRVRSRYLETARINMQIVEKEFSNGIVSVTEFTRITELSSRAEADYETARMDFLTTYMVLEEMVGIKFHLNP
jgi:outer membrane protein TolC